MPKLVFDIETIGEDFDELDETTQEVLTRWTENEQDLEYLKQGLGFSPLTGEIVAIGILDVDTNKGAVYYQAPGKKIKDSEKNNIKFRVMSESAMLKKFWEIIKNYQQIIGFNSRSFDAPFIIIRSAIHKIKPSLNLMPYRYAQDSIHIDLLDQLSFYGAVRKKGNLHLWSRAFSIESPKAQGVTGDDVAQLFKDKKYLDIANYNVRDLQATLELYKIWEEYIKN